MKSFNYTYQLDLKKPLFYCRDLIHIIRGFCTSLCHFTPKTFSVLNIKIIKIWPYHFKVTLNLPSKFIESNVFIYALKEKSNFFSKSRIFSDVFPLRLVFIPTYQALCS